MTGVFNFFKRFFFSILTLGLVTLLTFTLLHAVPGGPFDQERELPPEIKKNLYEKYHLSERKDQPFFVWVGKNFQGYLGYLQKGNLGPSLKYRDQDVVGIVAQAMGPSFELGVYAFLFALIFGVSLGLLSAFKRGGWLDEGLKILSSGFISLPVFVLAAFFVLLFSLKLGWLPPALWEGPSYRILPVLSLGLVPLAYFFSFSRSEVQFQLKQDYIRTAYAKGLSPWRVVCSQALKNAAFPLLTISGPVMASLITGSFIVESLFSIPGLGRQFVYGVINRDYFLVMGITLVYASILIGLNWIVDSLYRFFDPRVEKI